MKKPLAPRLLVLLFGLVLVGDGAAAVILSPSQWVGGSGNWSDASNWNPARVPDNNLLFQFSAIIDNGSTVTVDTNVRVRGLFTTLFGPTSTLSIADTRSVDVVGVGGAFDGFFNGGLAGVATPGTGTLIIAPGVTAVNAGTLAASGGGTLRIFGRIDNDLGTIVARNLSVVQLNDASIVGGVVTTEGSGAIHVLNDSRNAAVMGIFSAGTGNVGVRGGQVLFNNGTLRASGGGTLVVNAASFDDGVINSTEGVIEALNASVVELRQGHFFGGRLQTSGSGVIRAAGIGFTVPLFSNMTNIGTFEIPDARGARILNDSTNDGVMGIFSAGTGNLGISGGRTLLNTGVLRASGGGTLLINADNFNDGIVNSTRGVIEARNASVVELRKGHFFGGALATSGSGVIRAAGVGFNLPLFSNVTNTGTFEVPDDRNARIINDSTNAGVMGIFSAGTGNLGISGGRTLFNTGVLRASGGGTLAINADNFNDGIVNSTGGVIEARNASVVELRKGHFFGGTLSTSGSGVIRAAGIGFAVPLFSNVTNTGTFEIPDARGARIINDSTNDGVMGIFSVGTGNLGVSGGRTLFNTGVLRASGGGTLAINAENFNDGIVNSTGGVIEARNASVVELRKGHFFGGTLATSGSGVIRAAGIGFNVPLFSNVTNTGTFEVPDARSARILNDSTNAGLMGIFSPGTGTLGISSGRRLFNTGTLAATNSGTLVVEGPGTLVNDGGTISVGVGSAVNVTANLSNLNAATGVLAGGTYDVAGILRFNNANIVSNAVTASIRLDGSASQGNIVDQIGQNALRGFANNSGTFTLANKAFNTSAAFTNAGTVNIGTGSSFTSAGSYTQTGGVTILNGVLTAANVSIQGGSLQGVGSIGGNVINTATAGAGTSPGLLTISGDYVQTASGHLLSEIAGLAPGTQYDVVDVHGTATLAGAIDVVLLDGFSPTADAYFDVLFADVILGEFDTESLPTLTGGVLSIAYLLDPAGLDVVRVSFDFDDGKLPPSVPPTRDDLPPPGTLPLAIPLPSTWALLIAGLLAMGLYPARKAI